MRNPGIEENMKVITEQKGRVFQADVAFIGLRRSTITNTTKVGLKELITYEKISTQGPDLVWKFMTSTHILGHSWWWRERHSSWNISLFAAAAARRFWRLSSHLDATKIASAARRRRRHLSLIFFAQKPKRNDEFVVAILSISLPPDGARHAPTERDYACRRRRHADFALVIWNDGAPRQTIHLRLLGELARVPVERMP